MFFPRKGTPMKTKANQSTKNNLYQSLNHCSPQRTIVGPELPNIPWQDRPESCSSIVWRFQNNPVIPRNLTPTSNSIFNSALVPFQDKYAGVFRVDNTSRNMCLHRGFSSDGYHFEIDPEPIHFHCDIPEVASFIEGYDPRVLWLEDRHYITWCNCYHGPTIGMAYTHDFETFHQMENSFLPFNRNGVLFPRRINGKYVMLSRPSDSGHTPFGDIFYSESHDLVHWGCHRHVMAPFKNKLTWQSTKIGAGPVPIETRYGWLLFYHGVLTSCNGFVYNMGVALLDLDKPWKVLYRSKCYLLSPQKMYECVGDVPNVVFPCASLQDSATGRIAIYYGCADTVTSLAFCQVDELLNFLKENSQLETS
jgi:beta-1,4-mannooligosaccharide/beta-1,4-mannosyl-N-acetylglucosamine phosphorylase